MEEAMLIEGVEADRGGSKPMGVNRGGSKAIGADKD